MASDSKGPRHADEPSYKNIAAELPAGWLRRWPWVTFLLPMIVFMLVGSLEPVPPPATDSAENAAADTSVDDDSEDEWEDEWESDGLLPNIPYRFYPCVYTAKMVLTAFTMLLVWGGYRTFPWRLSPLAVVVGVVGVVLWIGLCQLQLETKLLGTLGLDWMIDQGERSAFNPLVELSETPVWAKVFLAIRFFGLALVVPIIEEFFLRGFLMRYVIHDHWWQIPFGTVNRMALVVGTAVPMLMHPGELLAALVWFSMVSWLMVRTRNIWDCVVAHATTNLLLGVYVVTFGEWQLM